MKLTTKESTDDVTVLSLEGSLNLEGVQQVEEPFLAQATTSDKSIIVDVSNMDFIASLGVRVLLDAARALRKKGRALVLLRPQPRVEQVLRLTGMDALIVITHDEAEARTMAAAK